MEFESLFLAAIQSSFLLGLIHGVNPCGHSWLVLAPFVMGEKKGGAVAFLTASFLAGTALACLFLGATLGTVSSFLPDAASFWVDVSTSIVLLILGLLLLYKPHLLHRHDDHHHHSHGKSHHRHDEEDHDHHHTHSSTPLASNIKKAKTVKLLAISLFGVGFVNMIIPCPTVAVMYGYALNSKSVMAATIVFGTYALSTAIAVGAVIYLIYKATSMAGRLQKDWIEPLIMRSAGLIIVIFSGYGLYSALSG